MASVPQKFVNQTLSQEEIDAFFRAATDGDSAGVMRYLQKYPTAIDEKDPVGRTTLMWAARYGRRDNVELLLKNGAAITERDNGGWTILMYAAASGNKVTVELLLEKGAVPDEKNKACKTALSYARERGRADIVALLEQWPETLKQRLLAEQKAKELADTDFSRGLRRPIPRPRPFKVTLHPQPKP